MSLQIEPKRGIRLQLANYSVIKTWQGGGKLWEHDFQLTIRQGLLGNFLPRATDNGDSTFYELFIDGIEVVSSSAPVTELNQVSGAQVDRIRAAVAELKAKAQDPRCDHNQKRMIEAFRLPDPQRDPELYRLYGSGSKRQLIVLWGVEKEAGTSLAAMSALERLPLRTSPSLSKSWLWLVLLLLLALAAWFYFQPSGNSSSLGDTPLATSEPVPRAGQRSILSEGPAPVLVPVEVINVTPKSGKMPTDPAKTPADPAKAPADPAKTPADPAKAPADPAKKAADAAKTPADPVKTPADPVKTPADPAKTPADPVKTPADPAKTPADPVQTPADPAKAPADPSKTPADPAKTPAEPIKSYDAAPMGPLSILEILSTAELGAPKNGQVDVTLNTLLRDKEGSLGEKPTVTEWSVDGKIQRDKAGKPLTDASLATRLTKGTHRVNVSALQKDGRALHSEAEIEVGVKVTEEGSVKVKPVARKL